MAKIGIKDGKGEWIKKRQEDGSYKKVCLCLNNIDFSGGCISNCNPDTGERSSKKYTCEYCYANYKNYHPHDAYELDSKKIIKELTDRFEANPEFKYLRLGKNCDPGAKIYRKQLIKTLEILDHLDGSGIFISKYLEYDKKVSDLAKKTNSVLCFSIGYDKLETGACLHGHNNASRIKEAMKYYDNGANSIFKLVTDVTVAPKIADSFGGNASKVLELKNKQGIYVSLLPFRIKSKTIARKITGVSWDVLKDQSQGHLFSKDIARQGSYIMEEKVPSNIEDLMEMGIQTKPHEKSWVTYLVPMFLDSAYKEFEDNNLICGRIGDLWTGHEFCDKCHMVKDGELLVPERFKQHLLPHVDTSELRNDIKESNKRKRKKNNVDEIKDETPNLL